MVYLDAYIIKNRFFLGPKLQDLQCHLQKIYVENRKYNIQQKG